MNKPKDLARDHTDSCLCELLTSVLALVVSEQRWGLRGQVIEDALGQSNLILEMRWGRAM